MTDRLTIVPAGAGAGKTWKIEKTLAGWIEEGAVDPGRILAVTFTEAAAAELKARIRAELLSRGRIDAALEIDRAYVGTIHALGLRLLTEHAFAAGRAPASRLLSEAERDLLIRQEIARCAALAPVTADLGRFGYAWNGRSNTTAEEAFRADLLRTVDLLRSLGTRGAEPGILAPALAALDAGYGAREADGDALTRALREAAADLLAAFPESLAPQARSDSARRDFARDHANLRRAATRGALERDWTLWQALRTLRLSKRGAPTPPGYDDAARAVMAAAEGLLRHPGPLADAKTHLTALVRGAQEILAAYAEAKRRAGVIDYADMIAEAEALLRRRPEIAAAVLGEIDCVVIDEFQDTNPVQFALLWRLARGVGRALIVGDTKQSIMGFQGADARLAEALQAAHADRVEPLARNFRSDPRIMAAVNAIGPALFPEGYDPLAPARAPTGVTALEAILLPRSWADRRNHTADCIADRIARLIAEKEPVMDKAEQRLRPVRPSDIAVLCYTAEKGAAVADAIRARGIPVRIQGEGWHGSPAVRAARAALAHAADPGDSHAALIWLTLGPARVPLADALRNAVDGVLDTHAALAPLRDLHPLAETIPVADFVARMLAATGLRDWAAALADPAEALADLARFEAEAAAFDDLVPDLRAAAGFHGAGPLAFLGWLAAQGARDWDRHPDPAGHVGAGIEIVTWHAAKGREWPVTVVAGLDYRFAERPGTLRAEFDRFDDLDDVLAHAGLNWMPNFAAPEKQAVFADARIADDERDAARALYVALTRARDRLILVLPDVPAAEQARPERMVDLLRERTGLTAGYGALTLCGQAFPCRITLESRDRTDADPVALARMPLPRFGIPMPKPDLRPTPWRQSPSALPPDPAAPLPPLAHVALARGVHGGADGFGAATERGRAWHRAFRTLLARPDRRHALAAATGLDTRRLDAIAAQAAALRDWLAGQGYDRLHLELPLQEIAEDGSAVNAVIDCLAEGEAGFLVLDHKSGPCPDPAARFAAYLPQLSAYARLVARTWPARPVRAIAINWLNEGVVSVGPAPQHLRAGVP